MSGFFGIEPVQGRDKRKAFLRCLTTVCDMARMPTGIRAGPDPEASPCPVEVRNPDLDLDSARDVVAEQAAACTSAWGTCTGSSTTEGRAARGLRSFAVRDWPIAFVPNDLY